MPLLLPAASPGGITRTCALPVCPLLFKGSTLVLGKGLPRASSQMAVSKLKPVKQSDSEACCVRNTARSLLSCVAEQRVLGCHPESFKAAGCQ